MKSLPRVDVTDRFIALICGYGVPEDILTDRSYHAYLTTAFNWLFDRYGNDQGFIRVNGGHTDTFPPYKRSEAEEIGRWINRKINEIEKPLSWQVEANPFSLSSVENLLTLNAHLMRVQNVVVFCEATRAKRIRRLVKAIFARKRIVRVVQIDFDGSPRRYQAEKNHAFERAFTRLELQAVHDSKALARVRAFMTEKLERMRELGPEEGHRQLPQILRELCDKYDIH